MEYKTVSFKTVFILFLLLSGKLFAIGNDNVRQIKWLPTKGSSPSNQETPTLLNFSGAIYNSKSDYLPIYFERIKLSPGINTLKVSLINEVYTPLSETDTKLIAKSTHVGSEIKITSEIGYDRKEPIGLLTFIPIRKNKVTGSYEKLLSFEMVINKSTASDQRTAKKAGLQTFTANSVLSNGNWYKIGVTADGIYKLSYTFLKNMGIDVASLNPKNIRIYGNGGGMLPFLNSVPRNDDLVENAVFVQGQNDATFGTGDYVLFYGQGPTTWSYNSSSTCTKFHHQVNWYSDTTYYFLTTDLGVGKRINTQVSSNLPATKVVKTFDDYAYHEADAVNLIQSGRNWYGEYFDIATSYSFSFGFPNRDLSSPININTDLVARDASVSTFNVTSQGASVSLNPPSTDVTCYFCEYAIEANGCLSLTSKTPNVDVTVTKITPTTIGWLNFIEVNVRDSLKMRGDQMAFRDIQSVGTGNISEFDLYSTNPLQLWEVTDPLNIKEQVLSATGTNYQFKLPTDSLRQFIAYNGNSFNTPQFFGKIANQNLHASAQTDLIIVTYPDFIHQANALADLHKTKDNLSVLVTTPQEIYNEFSSGQQDITAIRSFVKMFYDRAGGDVTKMPKYLMLVGRGSYDNKRRMPNNTNFIPTYQSDNSTAPTDSYVSDDFYGLLDDNEGDFNSNDLVDIGIGRLPVKSAAEAQNAVNKINKYISVSNTPTVSTSNCPTCANQANTSNFGDWRNVVCFMADDGDDDIHIQQADLLATKTDTSYKNYNIDKIYVDAYVEETTPGGGRYPDVNAAITKRVEKGALIINYTGHGGQLGLSHKRVLEISDIQSWNNINNMPLFFTATCEFSRFDDPAAISAGEDVFLNPNGGGIALFSTVRLVYSNPNFVLNDNFYHYAFAQLGNNQMPRLGDLFKLTKVASGPDPNNRNFTLLGDPALTLSYPKYYIYTTKINNKAVNLPVDTMKALSTFSISGYVGDQLGNKLTSYNGILTPTIFDKPVVVSTLSNDGPQISPAMNFLLQKSILYKGKASVTNGDFTFSFVVPKDIDYKYGNGKLSYYADNGMLDGSGNYQNIIVGGSAKNIVPDILGPDIKLYLNDTKFVFGGTTNESPTLYAKIRDSSGVNTVGNGIGHDITAILDANTNQAIVLNDYYQADLNSYKSGSISYPFASLSEGRHSLTLKVWDVYNNSSQVYTEFIVAPSLNMTLNHVLNYPNPFSTKTSFYFEHNQPCDLLEVQIQIYTVSGKLLKTINNPAVHTEGFRSDPIEWDGRDDFGDKIGRGVYVYHLKVRSTSTGSVANKFEKLVILN